MAIRLLALVLALAPALVGCGDDPPTAPTRGSGDRSKSKKTKANEAAAAATAGPDESKLPAKLRNVDWTAQDDLSASMRETRDPFAPYVEDLLVKTEDGKTGEEEAVTRINSIIADTPVEALQLIAILTGGAVHKAMVTDNRGLGHIVRPGDIVGKDPPMRVVRITRNEVLFRALEVGPDEEKPKEVQKVLLSQEELQELLP
ncbi:MAG: hypothetical protein R3F65_07425 [bacterium]|nr:hypothetical protein [Myxococcales bacterium]